jgi:serine/threonine protein kinase
MRDLASALEFDDPDRLGDYELLGRLGEGGMGTVYLARGRDKRRVALKVVRPELAADDNFIRRFHREVESARKVAGFCTARVLDARLNPPEPFLVTEYVEGVRLDRAVERSGPLGDSNLDGFAVGVAAALTAIHAAGVIHRDLKPSNVLLSYFGPRVIDFGIARALRSAGPEVTRASVVMGTPGWMAPEQLTGESPTQASDIFVWGTLVAYAATGRAPFGDGSPTEVAYRIVNSPPDLDGFDGPLRRTVEKAMAKEPGDRPSARRLLMELLGEQLDEQVAPGQAKEAVTQILRTWANPVAAAAGPTIHLDEPDDDTGGARRAPTVQRNARFPMGGPLTPPLPSQQPPRPNPVPQPVAAARAWPDQAAPPAPWNPQQPPPSQWGNAPWGNGQQHQAPRAYQAPPAPPPPPAPPYQPPRPANPPPANWNQPQQPQWGRPPQQARPAPPQHQRPNGYPAQRHWAGPGSPPQQQRPPVYARPQPAGQLQPRPQAQPPAVPKPKPTGGRKGRRVIGRVLAWASAAGFVLTILDAGQTRSFSDVGARVVALTVVLTIGFWILPFPRGHTGRGIFARLVGLIGTFMAASSVYSLNNGSSGARTFAAAIAASFCVTFLGYLFHPKYDRAMS